MTRVSRRSVGFGIAAVALAAVGLYGTARLWGNMGPATCAASAATSARIAPLAHGELAAFDVAAAPAPVPDLTFKGADGAPLSLARFRGRAVLLNLWATWCEPCKREMPALDRLQASLGGPSFEVVAVNIDTRDLDRPTRWLKEAGISNLVAYSDHDAKIFQDLRRAGEAEGLPTTILVGPDGCRVGRLAGWAEWASADGLALIKAAIGR